LLMTLVILLWTPTLYSRFQQGYWNKFFLYALSLSLLLSFLSMVFSSQNILTFFIFFELSLVPIIIILFVGGSSGKKLEAGLYIFAFTRFSALLFLAFLVWVSWLQHGINPFLSAAINAYNSPLRANEGYNSISHLIYNLATVVMLVKAPLFFLHMWLPKAHVEAPVFASIILASLLLKTGGYGYFILFLRHFGVLVHYDFSVCVMLLFSILAALRCSAQIDIKMLIAYSSVNHIRVILCGIILGISSSRLGRVILMIGHGIISSILFFLARGSYKQIGTRSSFYSLTLGKSNINMVPWLILALINAGLPPFLIFMGEVLILKASLMFPFLIFLFSVNYVLVGYYSCLILVKLVISKFPINVGRLVSVGLAPHINLTVILMHLFVLINITLSTPWIG